MIFTGRFLLVLGLAAAVPAFPQGGAKATAWGHRTPGQIDVPQDKSVEYYVDNVWTLEVSGKDPAQVKKSWTDLNKKRLSAYCFDTYKLDLLPLPMGDKGVILDIGGKGQLVMVTELQPGQSTEWHTFGYNGEPMYYVVQGQGRTEWYNDAPPWSGGMPLKHYEWSKGSFWAIAPDQYIRHTNTGTVPTRVVEAIGYGVNLYPYINEEKRIGAESKDENDAARGKTLETATLEMSSYKDLRELKVVPREYRGTASAFFDLPAMVGHRTHANTHVSQLLRNRANAHKHDGQPFFVFLQGRGHDYWAAVDNIDAFKEALAKGEAHRAEYHEGSICAVPAGPHWHQHWSEDPDHMLRYLAVVPRLKTMDPPPPPTR
ncbi:MAG TPA: cupin domain-containing protein [Bryobacteraceae bacterium]|nr:cupin domain-containing protein [Bryobacteraceae bacterium]